MLKNESKGQHGTKTLFFSKNVFIVSYVTSNPMIGESMTIMIAGTVEVTDRSDTENADCQTKNTENFGRSLVRYEVHESKEITR